MPLPEEGVLSPELQDFILQCMRKDPFRRPTAEGLLSHEYIVKVSCSSLQRVTWYAAYSTRCMPCRCQY